MSAHVSEALWEYALGSLDETGRAEVESHLGECARCVAELDAARETLAQVALDLPPEPPPASVRERLMESTRGRYAAFVDKLAILWDLGREQAAALLDSLATAVWEPSGIPGVDLIHVEPGPRVAHADAGFIRFAPQLPFPHHGHQGDEKQLVLDGGMLDDKGCNFHPGDFTYQAEGSTHSFVASPEGCMLATLLVGGIVIDGVRYGVKS
jgi:anti-sigma factor ChrR (cupin superfamily)